jgi:hypothetical protein
VYFNKINTKSENITAVNWNIQPGNKNTNQNNHLIFIAYRSFAIILDSIVNRKHSKTTHMMGRTYKSF